MMLLLGFVLLVLAALVVLALTTWRVWVKLGVRMVLQWLHRQGGAMVSGQPAATVKCNKEQGLVVQGLHVSLAHLLRRKPAVHLPTIAVKQLCVRISKAPRRVLYVAVSGVLVQLQQQQLPEPDHMQQPWNKREATKLLMLDNLLWGSRSSKQHRPSVAWLQRTLVQLLLNSFLLELTDVAVQYIQEGVPGPSEVRQPALCRDAIAVAVREARLEPLAQLHRKARELLQQPDSSQQASTTSDGQSDSAKPGVPATVSTAPATPSRPPAQTPAANGNYGSSPQVPSPVVAAPRVLARTSALPDPAALSAPQLGPQTHHMLHTQSRSASVTASPAQHTLSPAHAPASPVPGVSPASSHQGVKAAACTVVSPTTTQGSPLARIQQDGHGGQPGSRLTVAGVSVNLMTKMLPVTSNAVQEKHNDLPHKPDVVAVPIGLRTRRGYRPAYAYLTARRSKSAATAAAASSNMDKPKAPSTTAGPSTPQTNLKLAEDWDASYCVLQQWGLDVTLWLSQTPRALQENPAASVPALHVSYTLQEGSSQHASAQPHYPVSMRQQQDTESTISETPLTAPPAASDALLMHWCIDARLKALVLQLPTPAALVGLRVTDRLTTYSKYAKFWQRRPQMPVKQAPAAWWQHAARCVLMTCRDRYPVRSYLDVLAARREYMMLYCALHYGKSVTHRYAKRYRALKREDLRQRAVAYLQESGSAGLKASMQELETKLTLGQAMLFRTVVALLHSRYLSKHADSYQEAKAVLDMLAMFADALPLMDDGTASKPPDASITLQCPRLGVQLTTNSLATSDTSNASASASAVSLVHRHQQTSAQSQSPAASMTPGRSGQLQACVLLTIEGVDVALPDPRHVRIIASTIRASTGQVSTAAGAGAQDDDSGSRNAKVQSANIVCIPAPADHLKAYGPKTDFSSAQSIRQIQQSQTKQGASPAVVGAGASSLDCTVVNPSMPAPISDFLSAIKVSLAAVEVSIGAQSIIPCMTFAQELLKAIQDSRCNGQSGKIQLLSSKAGQSINAMVDDSYKRHQTPVPSSLRSFIPRLQVDCPQVLLRYQLGQHQLSHTGSANLANTNMYFTVCLSQVQCLVRYVSTMYGLLCQQFTAHTDLEVAFQALPLPGTPSSAAAKLKGQYIKLWLHPADSELLFDTGSKGRSDFGQFNSRHTRMAQSAAASMRSSMHSRAFVESELAGASHAGAASKVSVPPCFPFFPVLMAKHVFALGMKQVPYEPTVPGQTTMHVSVGTYGVMAWYSAWQAELIGKLIDTTLNNPLVQLLSSKRKVPTPAASAATSAATAATQPASAMAQQGVLASQPTLLGFASQLSNQPNLPTIVVLPQRPKPVPRTSFLLDVPVLSVAVYALMAEDSMLGRNSTTPTNPRRPPLHSPPWVQAAKFANAMRMGPAGNSDPDMVLGLGEQLAPLFGLHIVDLGAGARQDGSSMHAQLTSGSIHVSNQQLRSQITQIWDSNSCTPRQVVTNQDQHHTYMLGPLTARLRACSTFARDRRRALHGIRWHVCPTASDARALRSHYFKRALELYMLMRSTDYALFLLTRQEGPVPTSSQTAWSWYLAVLQHMGQTNHVDLPRPPSQRAPAAADVTSVTPSSSQPQPSLSPQNSIRSTPLDTAGFHLLSSPRHASSPTIGSVDLDDTATAPATRHNRTSTMIDMLLNVKMISLSHRIAREHVAAVDPRNKPLGRQSQIVLPSRPAFRPDATTRLVRTSAPQLRGRGLARVPSGAPLTQPQVPSSVPPVQSPQPRSGPAATATAGVAKPHSMASVFADPRPQIRVLQEQEQSGAAGMPGSWHGSASTERLEEQLSFIKVARQMQGVLQGPARLVTVSRVPFSEPNFSVTWTSHPPPAVAATNSGLTGAAPPAAAPVGDNVHGAQQTLRVGVNYICLLVPVHSVAHIVDLLKASQKAMSCIHNRAASTGSDRPHMVVASSGVSSITVSSTMPAGASTPAADTVLVPGLTPTPLPKKSFKLEAQVVGITIKVLVEESPGIKRENSATQLTSVTLLRAGVRLLPQSTATESHPAGSQLQATVQHAVVRDLQAAVEHRRVLTFKPEAGRPAIELLCVLPSATSAAPSLAITANSPRVVFVLRYLQSVLYAVNILYPFQKTATVPTGTPSTLPPSSRPASTTQPRPKPVISVQVSDLEVLLPGTCACLKGPIKHTLNTECVRASSSEVQLVLPGNFGCTLDEVLMATQEAVLTFFRSRDVELQDWLLEDIDISRLMASSEQLLEQHCSTVHNRKPAADPDATAQDGHSTTQAAADMAEVKHARAMQPRSRWEQLQHMTQRAIVKPIQQLVHDVHNLANNQQQQQEAGALLLRVDLDQQQPATGQVPGMPWTPASIRPPSEGMMAISTQSAASSTPQQEIQPQAAQDMLPLQPASLVSTPQRPVQQLVSVQSPHVHAGQLQPGQMLLRQQKVVVPVSSPFEAVQPTVQHNHIPPAGPNAVLAPATGSSAYLPARQSIAAAPAGQSLAALPMQNTAVTSSAHGTPLTPARQQPVPRSTAIQSTAIATTEVSTTALPAGLSAPATPAIPHVPEMSTETTHGPGYTRRSTRGGGLTADDLAAADQQHSGLFRTNTGMPKRLQPMLLFAIKDLQAHACRLQPGKVASTDIAKALENLHSADTDRVLDKLSTWQATSLEPLLLPTSLDGGVLVDPIVHATQLHVSVLDSMQVVMSPSVYQHILHMGVDNMAAGYHYFHSVTKVPPPRKWNTHFNENMAFGPSPKEKPFFVLTIAWEQLQGTLKNDGAWWDPSLAESGRASARAPQPLLRAVFEGAGLSLQMMQETSNMYLGFHCRETQVHDVRCRAQAEREERLHSILSRADRASSYGAPFASPQTSPRFATQLAGGSSSTNNLTKLVPLPSSTEHRASNLASQLTAAGPTHKSYSIHADSTRGLFDENTDSTAQVPMNLESDSDMGEEEGASSMDVADFQTMLTRNADSPCQPDVCILHSNVTMRHTEAAHLEGRGAFPVLQDGCGEDHACTKLMFTMLADGTMACEVELCHTSIRWPYLSELSLINGLVSIFVPTWCQGPQPLANTLLLRIWPWFYFNIIIRDSQVFLPVLSAHLNQRVPAEALHTDQQPQLNWVLLHKLFSSLLQEPRLRHNRSSQSITGYPPSAPLQVPSVLDDTGLALTMSVLRVGYFYGGDGQSQLKVDVRNAAGSVRLPSACVTNFLLPIKSVMVSLLGDCPRYEESLQLLHHIMLARTLTFFWRQLLRRRRKQRASAKQAEKRAAMRLGPSSSGAEVLPTAGTMTNEDASSVLSKKGQATKRVLKPHEHLLALAMCRAQELLAQHGIPAPDDQLSQEHKDHGAYVNRARWRTVLTAHVDTCAVRAAFSNVPLWQLLVQDVQLLTTHLAPDKGGGPFPLAKHMLPPDKVAAILASPGVPQESSWHFRRAMQKVDVQVRAVSVIVCNDKDSSFGAPDVLQAGIDSMTAGMVTEKLYFGHKPQQMGHVSAVLSCAILNNSTSSWEVLVDPWPVALLISNPVNKIFKDNRTMYMGVQSSEPCKVIFHPAALLTLGDTLAFVKEMTTRKPRTEQAAALVRRQRHGSVDSTVGADTQVPPGVSPSKPEPSPRHADGRHRVEIPPVEDQMGLTMPITSRVPQRYLILNQTGMMLWYWRPTPDGTRTATDVCKLKPTGLAQELKVQPLHKMCKLVGPGGVVITHMRVGVINVQFEGNWMPLADVSTDVVGKYCYYLDMPLDNRRVPVIVDVALIGRTKIIKLHSALYIQNQTNLPLGFRLHLPSTTLSQQVVCEPGDQAINQLELQLRPLAPGHGRYLPVVACLDGVLRLQPEGCQAAQHDVIRLSNNVVAMGDQQGYIFCKPLPSDDMMTTPMYFTVQVKVKSRGAMVTYSAQHSVEVPYPGEFTAAKRPLEATIKIRPTVVLSNSLPYPMQGYLVAVPDLATTIQAAADEDDMSPNSPSGRRMRQTGSSSDSGIVMQTTTAVPVPAVNAALAYGTGLAVHPAAVPSPVRGAPPQSHVLHSPHAVAVAPAAHQAGQGTGEQDERWWYLHTLNLFYLLAYKLGKMRAYRQITELPALPSSDVKRMMLAAMRAELRWASPRCRDNDLLHRADLERDATDWDKVSWRDLSLLMNWGMLKVKVVDILPGSSQNFYLPLSEKVHLALRVPQLALRSSWPVHLNHPSGRAEKGELPHWLKMRQTDLSKQTPESTSWHILRQLELAQLRRAERGQPLLRVPKKTPKHNTQHIFNPFRRAQQEQGILPFSFSSQPGPTVASRRTTEEDTTVEAPDDRLVKVELLVVSDAALAAARFGDSTDLRAFSATGLDRGPASRDLLLTSVGSGTSARPPSLSNIGRTSAGARDLALSHARSGRLRSMLNMFSRQSFSRTPLADDSQYRVVLLLDVLPDPPATSTAGSESGPIAAITRLGQNLSKNLGGMASRPLSAIQAPLTVLRNLRESRSISEQHTPDQLVALVLTVQPDKPEQPVKVVLRVLQSTAGAESPHPYAASLSQAVGAFWRQLPGQRSQTPAQGAGQVSTTSQADNMAAVEFGNIPSVSDATPTFAQGASSHTLWPPLPPSLLAAPSLATPHHQTSTETRWSDLASIRGVIPDNSTTQQSQPGLTMIASNVPHTPDSPPELIQSASPDLQHTQGSHRVGGHSPMQQPPEAAAGWQENPAYSNGTSSNGASTYTLPRRVAFPHATTSTDALGNVSDSPASQPSISGVHHEAASHMATEHVAVAQSAPGPHLLPRQVPYQPSLPPSPDPAASGVRSTTAASTTHHVSDTGSPTLDRLRLLTDHLPAGVSEEAFMPTVQIAVTREHTPQGTPRATEQSAASAMQVMASATQPSPPESAQTAVIHSDVSPGLFASIGDRDSDATSTARHTPVRGSWPSPDVIRQSATRPVAAAVISSPTGQQRRAKRSMVVADAVRQAAASEIQPQVVATNQHSTTPSSATRAQVVPYPEGMSSTERATAQSFATAQGDSFPDDGLTVLDRSSDIAHVSGPSTRLAGQLPEAAGKAGSLTSMFKRGSQTSNVMSRAGEASTSLGTKMVGVLRETMAEGGNRLVEKLMPVAETGMETMDHGVKWMQWGVTKILTQGGKRGGGESGTGPDTDDVPVQENVDQNLEGQLCPSTLDLAIENSMSEKDSRTCHIRIHAPFWIDNRTGVDLVFMDLDVPPMFDHLTPLLMYDKVKAPGHKQDISQSSALLDELRMQGMAETKPSPPAASTTAQAAALSQPGVQAERDSKPRMHWQAAARKLLASERLQVALLNEQNGTAFRVKDEIGESEWCDHFRIAATGHKLDITLKGKKVKLTTPVGLSSVGSVRLGDDFQTAASTRVCSPAVPVQADRPSPAITTTGLNQVTLLAQQQPDGTPQKGIGLSESPFVQHVMKVSASGPVQQGGPTAGGTMINLQAQPLNSMVHTGTVPKKQVSPFVHSAAAAPAGLPQIPEVRHSVAEPQEEHASPMTTKTVTWQVPTPAAQAPAGVLPSEPLASGLSTALSTTSQTNRSKSKEKMYVQRAFKFAVEIWSGPSDTVFKHTKVITVKNKYIVLNDTGLEIEYKQLGTPDPCVTEYGVGKRFAGRLAVGARSAIHWDNDLLERKELVIRPVGDDWEWSGSFELPEREEYFGLRIRRATGGYKIIPVNITVGSAGSVLVTLKSERSVPPYLVVNRCKDIVIRLRQVGLRARRVRGSRPTRSQHGTLYPGLFTTTWSLWDEVWPNIKKPMPFAWDEPSGEHSVMAVACAADMDMDTLSTDMAHIIPLDKIVDDLEPLQVHQNMSMHRPSAVQSSLGSLNTRAKLPPALTPSMSTRFPTAIRDTSFGGAAGLSEQQRVARIAMLLMRECAKKVYVTVYAEGPTRILCFSEEKLNFNSVEDENSVLNLMLRLRQLSLKMSEVDDALGRHMGVIERPQVVEVAPQLRGTPSASQMSQTHPSMNRIPVVRVSSHATNVSSLMPTVALAPSGPSFRGDQVQPTSALTPPVSRPQSSMNYGLTSSPVLTPPQSRVTSTTQLGPTPHTITASSSLAAYDLAGQQPRQLPMATIAEVPDNWATTRFTAGGAMPSHALTHTTGPPRHRRAASGGSASPPGGLSPSHLGVQGLGLPPMVPSRVSIMPMPPVPSAVSFPDRVVLRPAEASSSTGAADVHPAPGFSRAPTLASRVAAPTGTAMQLQLQPTSLHYPAGLDVPIGGDLRFRLIQATGLPNMAGLHAFAKVKVGKELVNSKPAPLEPAMDGRAAANVVWDFEGVLREVSASDQLTVKLYATSVAWKSDGDDEEEPDEELLARSRQQFLGQVELPLQETLSEMDAVGLATLDMPFRRALQRVTGDQVVRGEVEMAVEWQFTREGLLLREVQLLERLLAQKVEMLARMEPVPAHAAEAWLCSPNMIQAKSKDGVGAAVTEAVKPLGRALGHVQWVGRADGAGPSGSVATAAVHEGRAAGNGVAALGAEDGSSMPELNAQQISESYFINLDVSVLEVKGLSIMTGWQQAFINALGGTVKAAANAQQRSLPWISVHVSCLDEHTDAHVVRAAAPNLNPRFPKNSKCFENIALGNTVSIKVFNQHGVLRKTRTLIGEAELQVGAIPNTSPTYVWVPMWLPRKQRLHEQRAAERQARRQGLRTPFTTSPYGSKGLAECLQVYLRVQIIKPPARGVQLGLTLDLAGVGLCVKSSVYELLNFTLQRMRASMLQTSRELQLCGAITSFQLDNQLLETLRPVVLSPHNVAPQVPPNERFNYQSLLRYISSPLHRPLLSFQLIRSLTAVNPGANSMQQQQPEPLPPAAAEQTARQLYRHYSGRASAVQGLGSQAGSAPELNEQASLSRWGSLRARQADSSTSGRGVYDLSLAANQGSIIHTASTGHMLASGSGAGSSSTVTLPVAGVQQRYSDSEETVTRTSAQDSEQGGTMEAATIVSFKKLEIDLGPLDFITDQKFLESVYVFARTLPIADLWQDERWWADMEQMQGLAATAPSAASSGGMPGSGGVTGTPAQRSPRGGRSLGAAATFADSSGREAVWRRWTGSYGDWAVAETALALTWLTCKEDEELNILRSQSSSWFFIQELYIGPVSINITLSLSSNIDVSGGGMAPSDSARGADKGQRTILRGVITRLSGNTGFQLINVTNAPVVLAGKRWNSLLVNKVGLISLLTRHYSWLAMAETRKLLGGAGPAIAAVPAALLWAGISILELGTDVATKRVGARAFLPRLGFYGFTALGQIIGVASRMLGAVMALLPVEREGWLSDNEALRRFTRRPQNVVDAVYLSQKDLLLGFLSALAGPLLDPYEGYRSMPGALAGAGFVVGVCKAVLGLGVRPVAGFIESGSKVLQGLGLLCLGKRGIQGKLLRRVMAPGTPLQNLINMGIGVEDGPTGSTVTQQAIAQRAQLLAAWQASLAYVAPELADDNVVDVIAARRTRVVLLTSHHIAYLFARHHHVGPNTTGSTTTTTYKLKWFIPNDQVDNIRGVERTYRVSVEYRKPLKLGHLLLKLPLRRGMRTDEAEAHQNLIFRLNRHIGKDRRPLPLQAGDALAAHGAGTAAAMQGADLSITAPAANVVRRLD